MFTLFLAQSAVTECGVLLRNLINFRYQQRLNRLSNRVAVM